MGTQRKKLTLAVSTRTTTKSFGSSKREGHDASPFYNRFRELSLPSTKAVPLPRQDVDYIWCGDARNMDESIAADSSGKVLEDDSVALVVTSPPYFSGKEYELAMGEGGIPGSYHEYLDMLRKVFEECYRKLEPGGRIAVNVANLGRRPYRSLSADVIDILQDLKYLLRGEIIWVKSETSSGSCAWGSFRRASNPVLRDVSERIIVACKASFARAMSAKDRESGGWPFESTITRDAFMSYTTDIWEFPPEYAQRVGHPAPFPIELPSRLINLFTYEGDLVLDPFMGSGTTAVAAVMTNRGYAGFDNLQEYVDKANRRVRKAKEEREASKPQVPEVPGMTIQFKWPTDNTDIENFQKRATQHGAMAQKLGKELLVTCGFEILKSNLKIKSVGVEVNVKARSKSGEVYYFDISGAFIGNRPGLKRTDTLWKALGKATILNLSQGEERYPYILLTTDLPRSDSAGAKALRAAKGEGGPIFDVYKITDSRECERLWNLGQGRAS